MKEVYEFLKSCSVYYLATVDGNQPRVRPFGTIDLFEDKLYIQTGRVKSVDGDTAVIEDNNGTFTVDASRAKLAVGETCEVCVRTERMRVSRTPVTGFSLPCMVREARYAGGSVETFCLMAGGSEAVATGEERMADAAKPGDTVYLHFNPAQAAVIGGASYGA